ncbi:unnamed protein product [Orchesella dallaii]|uniref:Ketoreductase domain-containing protein n=1 Tax=Orchesella dallaii TaxID=48710 RepID=A0ABP1QD35_9HEXA
MGIASEILSSLTNSTSEGEVANRPIRNALTVLFWPVALPYLVYKFVNMFRRRFGLKLRPLEGKVVVITGASSGIGESLAKLLYEDGCRLILASRRIEELERVKADLVRSRTYGPVYVPAIVQLDLADLKSVQSKTSEILQIYGYVDILINNAGMTHRGDVLGTSIEVDQRLMSVNYFGPLALTKGLAHSMVERRSGRVVFVSSVQGKFALPFRSAYTASKHAVQALADSLRAELTDLGIKVTVVSPGYVKTQLSMNALTASGEQHGQMDASTASGLSPDVCARKIVDAIVNGDNDVVISSLLPRVAIFLRGFWPDFFFWLMANRARKELNLSS